MCPGNARAGERVSGLAAPMTVAIRVSSCNTASSAAGFQDLGFGVGLRESGKVFGFVRFGFLGF